MSTSIFSISKWFSVLLLTAVVLAGLSCTASAPEPTSTWNQEELTLDSGLRVLLLPHPGSGLVASNVFVGAGSTREEDKYAGSSHFLEHLLFNGTSRRTQEEIYAFTDRIGAYNNATTSLEYTHYMMVAPAEKLADALDLQADMLLHSILPPDKFEKERGIVLEELSKDKDDPNYRQRRFLDDLIHGEGDDFARPVLGTAETIAGLPRANVVEYYRRQYVPSNMRLILMGDFDRDRALSLITDRFREPAESDSAAPGALEGPPCAVSTPGQLAAGAVEAPKIILELLVPVPEGEPEAEAALALLARIAGGDKSARLERALNREPAVPHENAEAAIRYRQGVRLFEFSVHLPGEADPKEAVRRMLATVQSLKTIGEDELAAARTALLTQELSRLEQLHYYALFHGDRLWHMPEGFTPAYLGALETARTRSLGQRAEELLDLARIQAVAAGPGVADSRIDLTDLVPSQDLVKDLHPSGKGSRDDVERRRPGLLDADQPPQVITLENGLTVVHAASPGTRMFAVHLLVKNRTFREPEARSGIADLLHRSLSNALQASGDGGPSPLARLGATLKVADNPWIPYDDYYTTPLYSFVRLECIDEYYQEALELLSGMLRTPFRDSLALADARTEMNSARQRSEQQPAGISRARLREILYPDHPLSRPVLGDEAALAAVLPEGLAEFQERYFSPDQLVLAVVGNVPRDEALDAIRSTLGGMDSAGETGPEPPTLPVTTETVSEVVEGGGNQSFIRMARVVDLDPVDRWALIIAARVLSDQMAQDLRETRGLAYSLGISVDFHGGRAVLSASMGTRPENLEEAEAGMLSYFTIGELEVTPDEVETASNKYISRMRMRRVTSMGQAFTLGRDLFQFGDIAYANNEARGLEAVTSADVSRAVERYLSGGPLVTVIAR